VQGWVWPLPARRAWKPWGRCFGRSGLAPGFFPSSGFGGQRYTSISPEKQKLKKTLFDTSQENVFQSNPKTGIKNHPRRHIFLNSGPTFMIMFVAPVLTVRPFLNAPIRMGATCCGSPLHFGPCKKTKERALGKKKGICGKKAQVLNAAHPSTE